MNTITYNQMFNAARAGYPVRVVINGETYNFILEDKKEGVEDENNLSGTRSGI